MIYESLRAYQLKAVQVAENAVISGQKNILLATRIGKTRATLEMIFYNVSKWEDKILYDEESMPSITNYNLIIMDEIQRGYILDKKISEDDSTTENLE